mmetsp:Transcript_39837/g.88561  ORF Transcript_39837/g.88561 Transcript_39837/m.88561 type:complete len:119 (+) Transcript_39837:269-625(+)
MCTHKEALLITPMSRPLPWEQLQLTPLCRNTCSSDDASTTYQHAATTLVAKGFEYSPTSCMQNLAQQSRPLPPAESATAGTGFTPPRKTSQPCTYTLCAGTQATSQTRHHLHSIMYGA